MKVARHTVFVALILTLGAVLEAQDKIYWTDRTLSQVLRADLDGSNPEVIGNLDNSKGDLALDADNGRIYWTYGETWTSTTMGIYRANLDGTSASLFIRTWEVNELALDHDHGKIYWSTPVIPDGPMDFGSICRADLDGANWETLISGVYYDPLYVWNLSVDGAGGRVYWTDTAGTLFRANLDCTDIEQLSTDPPVDFLALDPAAGKRYWSHDGGIYRSDLEGGVFEALITGLPEALVLTLDLTDSRMYWRSEGYIHRSCLAGTNRERVFAASPSAIAVLITSPATANPCDAFFGDDFEQGDPCRWSRTMPPRCAELTVRLPGGVDLTLLRIPAGSFTMGAYASERGAFDDEYPSHAVTLTTNYYLGRTEITQAQWEAVMGSNPATSAGCASYGIGDGYPVYCVSWQDIAGPGGFIDTLNAYLASTGQPTGMRLPTEAEWEYAARTGTSTRFSFGDCLSGDDQCAACTEADSFMTYCGNNAGQASLVGDKAPNAFGLHDMHGNIFEFVADWYALYEDPPQPQVDPTGPATGTERVLRGGFWYNIARNCRSAKRHKADPTIRGVDRGFRLAKSW